MAVITLRIIMKLVLLLAIYTHPIYHSAQAWTTTLPAKWTKTNTFQSRHLQFSSKMSLSKETNPSTTPKMATGTNDSGEIRAEIIGSGRIGSLLAEAGECSVLGRNDQINTDDVGKPIIITTRNDALENIVNTCPINRRADLVFIQNGYLDDFLTRHDLLQNTQVLLYLSVPAKGVPPVDGVTRVNPEGLTTATGKHAQAFAERLAKLNMKCHVVDSDEYRPAMFEKLIWICTYMLVGTVKKCKSVGEAGTDHDELVKKVINELVTAVSNYENIVFSEGTVERLAAYTEVVADFPCGVKEFEWRNQYFYNLGDAACPVHNSLLRECEANGLLSFKLI